MNFVIGTDNLGSRIVLAGDEWPGVIRTAGYVAGDIEAVTGVRPEVSLILCGDDTDCAAAFEMLKPGNIYAATVGHSALLDRLADSGVIDLTEISGKREVYLFRLIDTDEGSPALVIVGSDKRGTIYGLFKISEKLGVSPWVYFADAVPAHRDNVVITENDNYVSREPSVEYRGIFINDEWPSFGNWTFKHFGGFTVDMYEHVFELILRLKGNYLWPAMWTSNFSLDGPGLASAVLADELGIVMSNSHHEPCLRHSEEWDIVKGDDTPYGTEWNFDKNKDGLTNYWRDGLKRNGGFENIVTMGMRGERDSEIMGAEATLKDNIDYIKEVVEVQNRLISETINEDVSKVPRMIAIYKEVEKYYYGDESTEGLRDWDGLNGITCMLCEDNQGNMRGLPDEAERDRDGGFGMYYHFDYHGGPVSYEWINSTSIAKTWEQMCEAYEAGVRRIWIVNTGDLKPQELPISFFMDLAYDYDKWGISNAHSAEEYLHKWTNDQFGQWMPGQLSDIEELIDTYTYLNHCRKPEALDADTYHPFNYGESKHMLTLAADMYNRAEAPAKSCKGTPIYDAYEELVGFPVRATANLLYMQLCAGRNKALALMGCPSANIYADYVDMCFKNDSLLQEMYHALADGKWSGMMGSEHIGFRRWNDEEAAYPLRSYVYPSRKPRMSVRLSDSDIVTCGGDWTGQTLTAATFLDPARESFGITIENAGTGDVEWEASSDTERIRLSETAGVLQQITSAQDDALRPGFLIEDPLKDSPSVCEIMVSIDRSSNDGNEKDTCADAEVTIKSGFAKVTVRIPYILNSAYIAENDVNDHKYHYIPVVPKNLFDLCGDTVPKEYITNDLGLVLDADDYDDKLDGVSGRYETVSPIGKYRTGVKAYPVTEHFDINDGPALIYNVFACEDGQYDVTVITAPSNPIDGTGRLRIGIGTDTTDGLRVISMVDAGYMGGENNCPEWCAAVIAQEHTKTVTLDMVKGTNRLMIRAIDPGVLLERILIRKSGTSWPDGYMGVIRDI